MGIQHRAAIFILISGFCLAFAGVARAEDPLQQLNKLKQWGATHKACDGWSDGCALCARRDDGSLGCSRMGVDCQVTAIECTQLARDPKTHKTPPPQ